LAAPARALFEAMVGPESMPHDCRHGDGSPLAPGDLAAIRRAMAGAKLLFDWRDQDVLLIDNCAIMHGREPFAGPRRILAYLAAR
ncbi:MAG TPA: TauD/TfdA family dioxygenase, partial [Allosphingosinicella sp.]